MEYVADNGLQVTVERIGIPAVLVQAGKQREQRAGFGMTGENVAARVRAAAAAPARFP